MSSSVYMTEEASRTEQEYRGSSRPRSVKPSLCGLLALIGRMLFYRPVWTKTNQQHPNVRFIYVHFSAWHFAGSDLLWAGIAVRLFHAIQWNFGKLQMVLYRVGQHDNEEEEDVKEKVCVLVVYVREGSVDGYMDNGWMVLGFGEVPVQQNSL